MGQYCETCGKWMKFSDLTHCSDECLLSTIRDSTTLAENGVSAITWEERSDPWN